MHKACVGLMILGAVTAGCSQEPTTTSTTQNTTVVSTSTTPGVAVSPVDVDVSVTNSPADTTMSSATPAVSESEREFMKEAADGGMTEVKLGELATKQAKDPDVKQFGQMMIDDHSKANEQLKQLASNKGVDLPNEISQKHQEMYDRLSKLEGDEFDKAYIADMLEDHKKDVAKFQEEAQSATDPQVKEFAANTLPVLQKHLESVQKIADKLGVKGE